ncbi:MAG TPA: AI-2E family transporter, partial [Terriglobales bacterium]
MSLIDTKTARVLFTVLIFTLALGFLYVARETLIAFLFAIFFAYLVDPAVSRVEKWTHSRGWAIAAIYILIIGLLITFFFIVGPRIGHQAQTLSQSLPSLVEQVGSGQIAEQIGSEHHWSRETIIQIKGFLVNHREDMLRIAQRIGVRVAAVAKQSWLIVLIPILAAFFLREGQMFRGTLVSFISARPQREFVENVLKDLNDMLAQFIRAQLTLAGLSLLVYSAGLGTMQVEYWLVLGTAGGMLEFIPVVGPLTAAVLIIAVSILTGSHWLAVIIFLGIWRLIQDYVITPRVLGKSTELHPLAAIFGVLAGGEIAGILGIYLSIPVMASLRIVWRRRRLYAEKRRFGPLTELSY